ncbi:DUF6279 family lipoprotein [Pseudomonas sp. RIT-PI-AD]|uniref:DUF6279 family lipoprotein n=1 Tax=Pseudomonas sp. RIT-PI-AD TaxID=3035294 RepID=UPI0021DA4426|nr:DUF6279 family lipoprotein [Pseudomonas sp. RIT-PI-AD]
MPVPDVRLVKHLLLCLGLILASACTRLDLAYRNVDWLVPWSLRDYADLDKAQKGRLDASVKRHLAWHCAHQLPAYVDWLGRARDLSQSTKVDPTQVAAQLREMREAVQAVAVRITPDAIELARSLSDDQVAQIGVRLDEDRRKWQEDYLDPPVQEQIEARAKRMQKRLQGWFGRLTPEQRQRVLAWSTELGAQNSLWLGNRENWQKHLREALARRADADFPAQLTELLQNREQFWSEAYQASFEHSLQAFASLLADLLNTAEPEQREHLRQRLDELRQRFADMPCTA